MTAHQTPPPHRLGPAHPPPPVGANGPAAPARWNDWPVAPDGLPTLFEDEGQDEMGENRRHNDAADILYNGLCAHLAGRPQYVVLCNLNFYYRPEPDQSYVS